MKIKSLILIVLVLLLSLPSFAISKDSLNAVTIVSYEQRWLDSEGTLALKNNTKDVIHNITYQIVYLDMSGTPLDYEVFSSEVNIAPGMTKKVDIPAYERGRDYAYYKSESSYNSKRFKIKFELNGYHLNEDEQDKVTGGCAAKKTSEDDGWVSALAVILGICLGLGLFVGLYVLVAVMAKQRRRSAALWVLLSLVTTPFLVMLILLCIGKASNEGEQKIVEFGE